ncbi:MAG: endonuclease/exonuclease/phosphatase family protein [Lachnospiraceae bacterium]|nr:endonuclease/exonuclease/phosphatase family protein [Lachnospiraceae bacterium]
MKKISVASHNICFMGYNPIDKSQHSADGEHRMGYEADMVEPMKERWNKVMSSFSADIIGIQEYCPWFDAAQTEKTEDVVYRPFGYDVIYDGGISPASKWPMEKVYKRFYEPVSQRVYQKFIVNVDGDPIVIFNTHPTPKDNGGIRKGEYEILLSELKKEERFIAFGDFNARTPDEFIPFLEAGYYLANSGIRTVTNNCTCDNIICSSNIRIEKVDLFDRQFSLSDHCVLYAELRI